MKNWKILVLIFLTLFLAVFLLVAEKKEDSAYQQISLSFGGYHVLADVADTDKKRTLGLSGRNSLDAGQGMFFMFDKDGKQGFWMKEMNFPIDIIWLNKDLRIVGVKENTSPASYPEIFYPQAPARYVLEIPAGSVAERSLVLGSIATLAPP